MNVRIVSSTTTRTARLGRLVAKLTTTTPVRETQPESPISNDELAALLAGGAQVKAYWV